MIALAYDDLSSGEDHSNVHQADDNHCMILVTVALESRMEAWHHLEPGKAKWPRSKNAHYS